MLFVGHFCSASPALQDAFQSPILASKQAAFSVVIFCLCPSVIHAKVSLLQMEGVFESTFFAATNDRACFLLRYQNRQVGISSTQAFEHCE